MNTAKDAQANGTPPSPYNLPETWHWQLALFGAGLTLIIVLFLEPIQDAVYLWSNRSAYNHCYLIIPISLYLLWDNRDSTLRLQPTPSLLGLAGIAGFSVVWIFSAAAGIAEGEHIAIVGLIQGLIIAIFGWQIYRQNLIAFLYLWLLVPTGTFLLPTLQQIATVQTEFLLNLSGIPNFVEGFIVEVPTGRYHIAPGCAGLNFILSSIALSPLYGYLIYQSWYKRLAAIFIMLIVALVANAVRIFAIIALAEWSERQIDIVDDHLLYGWGFFAVILLLMGWLGLRFEDPPQKNAQTTAPQHTGVAGNPKQIIGFGVIAIILILPAPLYYKSTQQDVIVGQTNIEWPERVGDWTRQPQSKDWHADFPQAHDLVRTGFSDENQSVDVNIAYYWQQVEGREMIGGVNRPGGAEPWFIQARPGKEIDLDGIKLTVLQHVSARETEARLVWHWYWVDGQFLTRSSIAKLRQAKVSLIGGEKRAAAIVLSTDIETTIEEAAARLNAFVNAGLPLTDMLSNASPAVN